MKYKEGNGVAEKSFVSVGEDNRRRLDRIDDLIAKIRHQRPCGPTKAAEAVDNVS